MAESNDTVSTMPKADNWCHTELQVTKFSNVWTIDNISSFLQGAHKELNSPKFSSRANPNIEWRLQLYPCGENIESIPYISVFLVLVSCNPEKITADFTLSVLTDKSQRTNIKRYKATSWRPNSKYGFEYFIDHDLLKKSCGLLSNDMLTFYCHIRVITDSVKTSGGTFKFNVPQCTLLDEFEQLLDTKKLSDVIISVDGHEFYAHKAILAARSPVFSAMFEHDMKEKEQNLVEITDMAPEIVGEMLRFIYTGRIPKLEPMAEKLLAAADKYALGRLKVLCEEHLGTKLSLESAADLLVLADRHSGDQLKTCTLQLIATHPREVMRTNGFKTVELSLITKTVKRLAT